MADIVREMVSAHQQAANAAAEALEALGHLDERLLALQANAHELQTHVTEGRDAVHAAATDLVERVDAQHADLAEAVAGLEDELQAYEAFLGETRDTLEASLESAQKRITTFHEAARTSRDEHERVVQETAGAVERHRDQIHTSQATWTDALALASLGGRDLTTSVVEQNEAMLTHIQEFQVASEGHVAAVQTHSQDLADTLAGHAADFQAALGEVGDLLHNAAGELQEKVQTYLDTAIREVIDQAFQALKDAIMEALGILDAQSGMLGEIRQILQLLFEDLEAAFPKLGELAAQAAEAAGTFGLSEIF